MNKRPNTIIFWTSAALLAGVIGVLGVGIILIRKLDQEHVWVSRDNAGILALYGLEGIEHLGFCPLFYGSDVNYLVLGPCSSGPADSTEELKDYFSQHGWGTTANGYSISAAAGTLCDYKEARLVNTDNDSYLVAMTTQVPCEPDVASSARNSSHYRWLEKRYWGNPGTIDRILAAR